MCACALFPLAAATKQFGSKRVVITDANGRNQFHGAHIYVMVGREQVTRNTNLKGGTAWRWMAGRSCVARPGAWRWGCRYASQACRTV